MFDMLLAVAARGFKSDLWPLTVCYPPPPVISQAVLANKKVKNEVVQAFVPDCLVPVLLVSALERAVSAIFIQFLSLC